MSSMNLILWRHAEAEDIGPDHTDASRRLTAHGCKQADKMAAWLNRHLPPETRILASPAQRTQQTVRALNRPYETEPLLFTDFDHNDYLAAAGWHHPPTRPWTLLVGHQPTLGAVAAQLLCGQAQAWSVKKGAIWWLVARQRQQQWQITLRQVLAAEDL